MTHQDRVLTAVRAAFEREPRINLHKYSVRMDFSDGVLTLEGEVEHVAAKKLSLELAIAVPGVTGIVDRLHVGPSIHMGDGAILDAVRNALLQALGLQNCTVQVKRKGIWETVREATVTPHGVIQLSVTDGIVLLDDHVTSLIQKRLAGVLAWWVPGSRDVVNGMEVAPLQEDSDEEIAKAVRLVLGKDPLGQRRAHPCDGEAGGGHAGRNCALCPAKRNGRVRCLVCLRCRQGRQSLGGPSMRGVRLRNVGGGMFSIL